MNFQTFNLLFKCGKEFSHKKVRNLGLNDTEFMICSFVYSHESCSQDDVVQGLHMDKTTVAKAIALIEAKGFIIRVQDPVDHRKKILSVTPFGKDTISAVINMHEKWFDDILSVFSADEQEQFENYCNRLLTAAERKLSTQKSEDTE